MPVLWTLLLTWQQIFMDFVCCSLWLVAGVDDEGGVATSAENDTALDSSPLTRHRGQFYRVFFYCFTEFYPRTIELMRDDSTSTFSSLMAGPIEFLSGYRRLGRLFTELLPGFTVQSRPTG